MLIFAAELGAQTADVHVDRARAAVVVIAPHLLQQLRAREHPARMLHQVFEQFEFLVGQIDRDATQVRGVAVGVHDQLARADQSVLLRVGLLRRAICGHSVGVAALRDKAQTSFHLGGRGARHDHIAHTPLRIDHGEASLGQDEQDRRGQAGGVDHAAQRLRVRQVVAAVEQ